MCWDAPRPLPYVHNADNVANLMTMMAIDNAMDNILGNNVDISAIYMSLHRTKIVNEVVLYEVSFKIPSLGNSVDEYTEGVVWRRYSQFHGVYACIISLDLIPPFNSQGELQEIPRMPPKTLLELEYIWNPERFIEKRRKGLENLMQHFMLLSLDNPPLARMMNGLLTDSYDSATYQPNDPYRGPLRTLAKWFTDLFKKKEPVAIQDALENDNPETPDVQNCERCGFAIEGGHCPVCDADAESDEDFF